MGHFNKNIANVSCKLPLHEKSTNIHSKTPEDNSFHGNIKAFRCNSCEKCYSADSSLRRHIASEHENKRENKCPHCEKHFLQNQF